MSSILAKSVFSLAFILFLKEGREIQGVEEKGVY
jgi:hypothetical protein